MTTNDRSAPIVQAVDKETVRTLAALPLDATILANRLIRQSILDMSLEQLDAKAVDYGSDESIARKAQPSIGT